MKRATSRVCDFDNSTDDARILFSARVALTGRQGTEVTVRSCFADAAFDVAIVVRTQREETQDGKHKRSNDWT